MSLSVRPDRWKRWSKHMYMHASHANWSIRVCSCEFENRHESVIINYMKHYSVKTFAIVGCGHLGKIVREAYGKGLLDSYRLVAACSMDKHDAIALVEGTDAKAVDSIDEIIAMKVDYIIETAAIACLKDFAVKALEEGISVIPLSIGAFADEDFKASACKAALEGGARIHIPSGAVGGFDAIQGGHPYTQGPGLAEEDPAVRGWTPAGGEDGLHRFDEGGHRPPAHQGQRRSRLRAGKHRPREGHSDDHERTRLHRRRPLHHRRDGGAQGRRRHLLRHQRHRRLVHRRIAEEPRLADGLLLGGGR